INDLIYGKYHLFSIKCKISFSVFNKLFVFPRGSGNKHWLCIRSSDKLCGNAVFQIYWKERMLAEILQMFASQRTFLWISVRFIQVFLKLTNGGQRIVFSYCTRSERKDE